MTEMDIGWHGSDAIDAQDRDSAATTAAKFLSLAAAPVFTAMALLTAIMGSPPDLLCAATEGAAPLNGMAPMYLLMSALHVAPWLRLFSSSRAEVQTGIPH